jgi:hypothetical protein
MSVIRTLVAAAGASGVTARDISSSLDGRALNAHINVIHAALSKMKQARLVTVKSGKYFPTAALTKTNAKGQTKR